MSCFLAYVTMRLMATRYILNFQINDLENCTYAFACQ